MAIRNINMIQHQEDVKYLIGDLKGEENNTIHYPTENEKDFYIQSLANMGQRVGTNYNGIKYSATTIAELFNISPNDIISIQYVQNENDILKAQVKNVSNDSTLINDYNSQNIYNKYFFTTIEEFSIPINNIEKYSKDSIIYNDGNYITMCLNGKLLGTDDSDENNVEIQYTKINVNTGIIDTAIRAFHLIDDTYIMLILKPNDEDTSVIDQVYKYKLLVTSFNLSNIEEEYDDPYAHSIMDLKQQIKNAFTWEECTSKDTIFNFKYLGIDITTADLDTILRYDEKNIRTTNTIFGLINNYANYHGEIEDKYFISDIIYNVSTDSELSFTEETKTTQDYKMQNNVLINDVYGLEGRLVAINNDIKYTYPNILLIYSQNKYNQNRYTLFYEILYSLYEKLYNECEDKTDYPILYIPGNYIIEYMYNSIDFKVYYTNDIFVTFINKEDYNSTLDILNDLNVIKFVYDKEEKVSCYKFIVKYNELYEDSIDTLTINEEYTLPYINSSNNWQINNKDSKLSAIGKNAGNPNIIITKVVNDNENIIGEIIIGSNYDILNSLDWKIKTYENNLYAYIPEINASDIQYLENAIIFNIYEKDNNSYSSIWTIKKNQYKYDHNLRDEYEFGIVTVDGNEILNIDSLFSLGTTIEKIIREENFLNQNKFKLLQIESAVDAIINSTTDPDDYICCNIHAKLRDEDDDNSYINTSKNNNDTVLKIEYELSTNDYYLKSANSYNDNLLIKGNINDSNYYKYELTNVNQEEHSYVVNEENSADLSSISTNNLSSTQNVNGIIENVNYNSNSSTISEEIIDKSYSYYTNVKYNSSNTPEYLLYSYEYLIGDNAPSIQLGEMLLQDVNVINRTNILSIDKGENPNNDEEYIKLYNSYIGSSFDDAHKNVLHIGSCSTNINVGTKTLIEPGFNQLFNTQDTLSLDLPNTCINSNYITRNAFPITKEILNDVTYNFISPQIISNISPWSFKLSFTNNIYSLDTSTTSISIDPIIDMRIKDDYENNIIFKHIAVKNGDAESVYDNVSEMIFINALIKKYCNININDYDNINLTVDYENCSSSISTSDLPSQADNIYCVQYINLNEYYIYAGIDKHYNNSTELINSPIYITWYVINNSIYININLKAAGFTDDKKFVTFKSSENSNGNETTDSPTIDDNMAITT